MAFNARGGQKAFEIDFVPDFTPVVAPKMVQAGLKVLEPVIKQKLEQSIGKGNKHDSRSTGGLAGSIRASNTFFLDAGMRFKANIYFYGADKHGVKQGLKAAVHEHGRKGYKPYDGSGFISSAVRSARAGVEAAMKQAFEDAVGT